MSKDIVRDYEYFSQMWNDKFLKSGNTSKHWDSRAGSWGMLLESESTFKRSLTERVSKTSDFLRSRGLLAKGDCVIDIGCGTGRFAAEFAKTAGRVTCADISENMLKLAKNYADQSKIENIEYVLCDFADADIDALGWVSAFDLVFTSITGAIGDLSDLEKSMKMSRGYCFNSSFIRKTDALERMIAAEVFGLEQQPRPAFEGRSFYALFNLLWLRGYYPETCYHRQNYDNMVPADSELAEFYEWSICRDAETVPDAKAQIYKYLQKHAVDGLIRQSAERWYGWTLWDVRNRDERR